jgi:putative ATPase
MSTNLHTCPRVPSRRFNVASTANRSTRPPVSCPICIKTVPASSINEHLDSGCTWFPMTTSSTSSSTKPVSEAASSAENGRRAASPDLVITGTSTSSTKLAPLFTPSGGGSAATATTPSSSSRKRKPYGDASSSFRRGGGGASRSSPPPVSSSSTATDPSSSSKRPKVSATLAARPLADALRPTSLLELLGQDAVLGEGSVLRALIEQGKLGSAILWGDPGTGKTTLARIVARVQEADVRELSAVSAKLDDVRKVRG